MLAPPPAPCRAAATSVVRGAQQRRSIATLATGTGFLRRRIAPNVGLATEFSIRVLVIAQPDARGGKRSKGGGGGFDDDSWSDNDYDDDDDDDHSDSSWVVPVGVIALLYVVCMTIAPYGQSDPKDLEHEIERYVRDGGARRDAWRVSMPAAPTAWRGTYRETKRGETKSFVSTYRMVFRADGTFVGRGRDADGLFVVPFGRYDLGTRRMAWLETGNVTTVVSGEFALEPVNQQPGLSRLKFCGRYDCKSTGVSDTFTMQSSVLSDEASAPEADDGGVPPPPLLYSAECESAQVGAETA